MYHISELSQIFLADLPKPSFRWAELYSIPFPDMGSETNTTLLMVIC